MIAFGPQLIGQTEKSLNAILVGVLDATGLSEPHWVTLRLAAQQGGNGSAGSASLASVVADRAHLADPERLVAELRERGLLDEDRPSAAGEALLARLGAEIAALTAPIWTDLHAADVAAAERVLRLVNERARAVARH